TRGRSPTDANKKADSKAPKDRSLNVKIKSQQFLSCTNWNEQERGGHLRKRLPSSLLLSIVLLVDYFRA
ncbi:MAG: hypothetical protein AB8G77_06220, partial [Rhodothermales bacterium]